MKNGKIQSFTDLNVWKEGHKLVVMVYKITRHFPIYYMAKGSLAELKNFILIAKDVGYLIPNQLKDLVDQVNIVDRLLQGFIRKSKTFINQKS